MRRRKIVVALGGNALLHRGEPLEAEIQRRRIGEAATVLALLARDDTLIVTHGNGPQVGLLALQGEAYGAVRAYPLDVLGAETEGMIGYLLEQELGNHLPGREIATLLTQVEVDPKDPAFAHPTKPIGPLYTEEQALRIAREWGYSMARDGDGHRRVVPSPEPRRVRELRTIKLLVDAGIVVVCSGGGGIPVVVGESGALRGVEAVIDKDLSAALLARDLGADLLLLLTDVDGAWLVWKTPTARLIRDTTPGELRAHSFATGSMGPKVEAACRFVEATGNEAAIGALDHALALARGEAGTWVRASRMGAHG